MPSRRNVMYSKTLFQLVFGLAAGGMMILMTLLTAHYKRYGPLEIITNVKKSSSSFRKTFGSDIEDHLQFVNGLQNYAITPDVSASRPEKIQCNNQVIPKRHIFANVSSSIGYLCNFLLKGFVVPSDKPLSLASASVQTELVHLFSKESVQDVRHDFVEWNSDVLCLSPAVEIKKSLKLPFELVFVSRISLNKEKLYLKHVAGNVTSAEKSLFDNYLYKTSYDVNLKKITHGSILRCNIPNVKKALSGDGPLDPRVFILNDRLFIVFNAVVFDQSKKLVDRMFVFMPDGGPDSVFQLNIDGLSLTPRDKGWVPLITADKKLHFVYRFEPLVIISCDPENFGKPCVLVTQPEQETQKNGKFADMSYHLRGGTPFVEYMHPYYVSVGHGTFFTKSGTRYYTSNIVLMNFQSQKIVYLSSDVLFSAELFKLEPPARPWVAAYPFFFPVGIHKSSPDELLVSGHFNDAVSALIRISGVQALFDAAIAMDLESVGGGHNAPFENNSGKLNLLLLRLLSNETGIDFVAS